jgi:putative glycosyltransferase (TIGR04348 family)
MSANARPSKATVVIVSPALASANNGNWHTAARWARFLRARFDVHITLQWPILDVSVDVSAGSDPLRAPDMLIALHARRSAASIAAYAAQFPKRPLIVALTGTDVYRDIHADAAAKRSLDLATHLITLQDQAALELAARMRNKVTAIYQSAPRLVPAASKPKQLTAVMVGHMRDEKDPLTYMRAARALAGDARVRFIQIGDAIEPHFATEARATELANPHYRWLGGLPRAQTRQWIKRAHLLVIPSRMEGGANVIIEAVQSGTPVLASRMSGNIGMLGEQYSGYFTIESDKELSELLLKCMGYQGFYKALAQQCKARSKLFEPGKESAALIHLCSSALAQSAQATRTRTPKNGK